MIRKLSQLIIISGLLLCVDRLHAQEKCGTVEYNKNLYPANFKSVFENWVNGEVLKRQTGRSFETEAGPYNVPVVIHVIHNGEPLGSGTNIPDEQILSQIKVLNNDFRRLNSDASKTPSTFTGVAGSMDIQFVLAKQDPEGLATTGIVRVNGGRSSWTSRDNYELKAKSYWPSDKYLNVWVCNITDYLGITQFPVYNLPGLESASNNPETDGIVVWYKAFGSAADGSFVLDPEYNLGRTLTHEMGHFFGLNHIWGDDSGDCSGSDYVNDTPNQGASTRGCPNHPATDACSTAKMFQNYMDYTDDVCMNLFTNDQVSRMSIIIENSPRRASLLTSPGLQNPTPVPNDLGITRIVSPGSMLCSTTVVPQVEIKNYGTNQVVSAQLQVSVNGGVTEVKNITTSLSYLQTLIVTFSAVGAPSGSNQFSFQINQSNGVTDSNVHSNVATITAITPAFGTAPFTETFNSLPSGWIIQNPDQKFTWKLTTAPKETPDNKAVVLNFFDYEDNYGEIDVLLTPVVSLSSASVASLMFDIANATYQGSNDRLKVVVLKNCEPLSAGTVVYDKAGTSLATVPSSTAAFTPKDDSQWRREIVNLNAFVGQQYVQLAFVGVNDWGNNLYLDNISLFTTKVEDISLKEMKSPGVVTCEQLVSPQVIVQNVGTVAITNLKINYSVNGGPSQVLAINNIALASGTETTFTLPAVNLNPGVNSILINLTEPNGATDVTPANNQNTFAVVVNTASDKIPLRETFDAPFEDRWTIANRVSSGPKWQQITTNFKNSILFAGFTEVQVNAETWLVSPDLDFSDASTASMVFDLSYAIRGARLERLRIFASTDCGQTFTEFSEIDLSNFNASSTTWTPSKDADWKKNVLVNLDPFAGQQNVRLAFVVTNQNGNNLYLDNIEFFVTDSPNTMEITGNYSVYGYNLEDPGKSDLRITFNLLNRQNVDYAVVDMLGKQVVAGALTNVLNQTFPLELDGKLNAGVYVIRLRIDGKFYAERILITE